MTVLQRLRDAGFQVYTREQWGTAREYAYQARRSSHPMPAGPARYHFLHITVTADTDTIAEGFMGARQVESYGLSTPPMVSYQALVTNEGRIYEGQNWGTKGTHTINDKSVPGYAYDLNYQGYAVAIMQNVQDDVTDAQVEAIAAVYAAVELEGLVQRGAPILPHRMFAWKECPGDKAVARLDDIKRLRDQYVQQGLGKEPGMAAEDVEKVNAHTKAQADRLMEAIRSSRQGERERDRRITAAILGKLDELPEETPLREVRRVVREELDKRAPATEEEENPA